MFVLAVVLLSLLIFALTFALAEWLAAGHRLWPRKDCE